MVRARLIDLEGMTVCELAVDDGDGHPPPIIEVAAVPKLVIRMDSNVSATLSIKRIVYRLERRDGGGTLVYRRETGPWG